MHSGGFVEAGPCLVARHGAPHEADYCFQGCGEVCMIDAGRHCLSIFNWAIARPESRLVLPGTEMNPLNTRGRDRSNLAICSNGHMLTGNRKGSAQGKSQSYGVSLSGLQRIQQRMAKTDNMYVGN
jgi:hypothetical protein